MACLALRGQSAVSLLLPSSSSVAFDSSHPASQSPGSTRVQIYAAQAVGRSPSASLVTDQCLRVQTSLSNSAFLARRLSHTASRANGGRTISNRRHLVIAEAAKEQSGRKESVIPVPDKNGTAKVSDSKDTEIIESLKTALAAAEAKAARAEKEKREALETAAVAEAKAESYAENMVQTTEEAMAEVESAKSIFKAELEKLLKEKTAVEDELVETRMGSIDLAVKVETLTSMAVQEATAMIIEEAKVKIAEAKTNAVAAAAEVEEKIRKAADEAASAVIAEAKATIEDALAAAEMAKEQARSAEAALQDRMNVLDELAKAEADAIKAHDTILALESKLRRGQVENHQLQMEVKAAMARAEAAESRVGSNEFALKDLQEAHEKAMKEREEATGEALESMKRAATARAEAAMLTYKAETESMRAAIRSAENAAKVREVATQRRCEALERSLAAGEELAKAWKSRALAVEEYLRLVKEKGVEVVAGADVNDMLNGGRMDVMLGDSKLKRKLLAEGPRRERPEWLKRKSTAGIRLPPLKIAPLDAPVVSEVPLELPKLEDVWSIAEHQLLDDVFTKEATKVEEEQKELQEQREQLERTLQRRVRRVKTPEELEDKHESAQGYMPVDYYNLNSAYGSMEELKYCIDEMHNHDIQVLGDVVLNHRCASKQSAEGIWNIFGGKLAWGPEAIVRDDPNFHGLGNPSTGDIFHAAPNVDHSQDFVRKDVKEWLRWLRTEVGYDGWRLDFVRGFWGGYVKEYIDASSPVFSIGEYWDSLAYDGGNVSYNQDAHRQRIINWINATGGMSSAFDVTTKGILHQALHNEYWRLIDPQGKPPGVMGWWPSRAVTFLENHDTGSTQAHWPFPRDKLMQGYAYILTHPGTPVIFYDHFYDFGLHDEIAGLLAARTQHGIHCRSAVKIFHATAEGYVAQVGDRLVVKLGSVDWNPSKQNDLVGHWERFVDHGSDYQLWEKY